MENGDCATIYVAPLELGQVKMEKVGFNGSRAPVKPLLRRTKTAPSLRQMQRSTTAWPVDWLDNPILRPMPRQPLHSGFLRAFCSFQPEEISSSTITLPLHEGDVILLHSVNPNGWADGTLLTSGSRGWLPTNYCDTYQPESIQVLLNALLDLWALLRGERKRKAHLNQNNDCVRGMIGGVRHLLVRKPAHRGAS